MNAQRGIFEQSSEAALVQADARARTDVVSGRTVVNAEVANWLEALGTPEEKPMPREWLE